MNVEQLLFAILGHTVCGQPLKEDIRNDLTPESISYLYVLSQGHDLAHIVGHTLNKLGVLGEDETSQKFKKVPMQAVYRYVQLEHEYESICKALEEAKIPFLPMKGAILRGYYPEPWMRTSCDIDVLVKAEDVKVAIDCLKSKLQYLFKEQYLCEYSMYSPSGVHIEIHSDAEFTESKRPMGRVMANVWNVVFPAEGAAYKMEMPYPLFYYYHIMHMAKHFSAGGCGIRPFLDIWILTRREEFCREECEELLAKGELTAFATQAEKLSEAWFAQGEKDALTKQMGHYILDAGVYGNLENNIAIRHSKKGGKIRYILSRLFLPLERLKLQYPIVGRHKWLLPIFQVVRWVRLFSWPRVKRTVKEIKRNLNISQDKITEMAELMEQFGL